MKIFFFLSLSLITALANAAGPLFVEGADGTTPVRYKNPVIGMNFDLDMLEGLTNAETDDLVFNAFSLWNGVLTSKINLTQDTDLPSNIDINNYDTYIPAGIDASIPDDDGLNPVIYDTNGEIIDAFFGINQSDQIAGFASSSFFLGTAAYTEGFAVINGKDLGIGQLQTKLIVAHEIGHFMGLDHSLVDIEEDLTVDMNDILITACTTKIRSQYPLMYPVVCRNVLSLHQDDIISVSTLYPAADISQQLGQITGKFLQDDANNNVAILGANIWVQNTVTMDTYSVVSDYLTSGTGFFSLYLPPGNYTLHANSIDPTFNSGSGVGPYSQDAGDRSFQAPHPIAPIGNPVNYEGNTGGTVALPVTIGEATNVTFKLDSTGEATFGNKIFVPKTTTKKSSGGGGGAILVLLMLLPLIISLRIVSQRRRD